MTSHKILIADLVSPFHLEALKNLNFEVNYQPKLTPGEFITTLASFNPHILIVRSRKVQKQHLESAPYLKAVLRAGAGVDNIDLKTATSKQITVCNTPGKNSVAVAELVFALFLALDRNIYLNNQSAQNNFWNKQELSKSEGIKVD